MSALEVEHLDGGNQYACDHCGRKVNATRQLRLRTLPPYLCMSLKRFVFDMRVRLSGQRQPPAWLSFLDAVLAACFGERQCSPYHRHGFLRQQGWG
jgi:ubiquitin carboxyl-terminal hydrolase 48